MPRRRHNETLENVFVHASNVDYEYDDDYQSSGRWNVSFDRPAKRVSGAAALAHPAIVEAVIGLHYCGGIGEATLTAEPLGDPEMHDMFCTAGMAVSGRLMAIPLRDRDEDQSRWGVIDTAQLRIGVFDADTGVCVYEWTAATGWTSPHDVGVQPTRFTNYRPDLMAGGR